MNILITGADGFIGRNLCLRLEEVGYKSIIKIGRNSTVADLKAGLQSADFIYHLAGVNRPKNEAEYLEGNSNLTKQIVDLLFSLGKKTPIMFSSSIQSNLDNAYGRSKAIAEKYVEQYAITANTSFYIYKYPNVFGKWCKPNYNSFVATFCHNIANNIDISINDPFTTVSLVYIDDVCTNAIELLSGEIESGYKIVEPVYSTTVGDVARLLNFFKNTRQTLLTEEVGTGFIRALYSTWLSYLPPEQFAYTIPSYSDFRGVFCEMLKTPTTGQFSFFTARSGITRGGHYHHSKNEKFLVVSGHARFRFKHVLTGESYQLDVSSGEFKIVETIPGWSHDVTNIGSNDLIVMLWANEIFNREIPDTIANTL